ncbi:uncharacterized protein LOC132755879 [Ruditapes philippinarum]|uniref:uncharacterized protein LOC132755879 n=1 Tax=Ruditapes philippinarum TaxID=129788 RepID=UPI00295B1267|nr:uncharacterized protein LOC132755879 [Ruditapes philippinarum]
MSSPFSNPQLVSLTPSSPFQQVTQSPFSPYPPQQVTPSLSHFSTYPAQQVTNLNNSNVSVSESLGSSHPQMVTMDSQNPGDSFIEKNYWGSPVRPRATYPYNSEESSVHLNGAFSTLYGSPSKCHSCCDRVDALERQVTVIQESMDKLIKKKKNKDVGNSQSDTSNQTMNAGYTKDMLLKEIENMGLSQAISHIMVTLFTTDELVKSSVMGVKNQRSSAVGLDPIRRTLLESIIKEKFGVTTTAIRSVMRNRKKIVKMRNFINNDNE